MTDERARAGRALVVGVAAGIFQTSGSWLAVVSVAGGLAVVHLCLLVFARPRGRTGGATEAAPS
ncbi:hypothetical protein KNO15_04920 [Leifsonia shinshuensis]|uniref:hypothetical protein n=1 Tax=Leifsonia shinshuensis TaxID=150026 RepID=UPI001F51299F|nr:hypothetical protein [Leifsonia shinshuensis]MCI0156036.1 hypothetical protein [Leifsonia shinshuensis]